MDIFTPAKKRPFIIHYCGSEQECTCKDCTSKTNKNKTDNGLFPTHTHGLDKLNQPEIFIDPLAFDKYNATLINNVYDYLIKPGKKDLIQSLLDGKIIKVGIHQLNKNSILIPGIAKDLIICMRVVYSDFEAVKLAYGEEVPIKIPFIQLYVLGDDFALSNEYYRGGVTW